MIALNSTIDSNFHNSKVAGFEGSYLGIVDYQQAVQLQNQLAEWSMSSNLISVIGLQHPAVITLGRRADSDTELNRFAQQIENIPVIKSSRGGLATLHSEGQLVIYPILNLRLKKWGVRSYVEILLRSTKQLLEDYGIEVQLNMQTSGLFTEVGKIAFCGIEVRNGVSRHGLSLNVNNDLNLFSLIRSCGISNISLDKMQNYQIELSMVDIFQRWIFHFKNNLT